MSLESDSPKSFHSKPFLVPDAVSDVLGSPGRGGGFSEREVHDKWGLGSWSRARPRKTDKTLMHISRTCSAHVVFPMGQNKYVLKLRDLSGLPSCEIPSLPTAELDSSLAVLLYKHPKDMLGPSDLYCGDACLPPPAQPIDSPSTPITLSVY